MQYTRDTMGRISQLKTKVTAAGTLVSIATSITYQPVSRLVKNFTYGNALTQANTPDRFPPLRNRVRGRHYTNDYELSQCQVKDGAAVVLGRSYARTDNLNLTGITDQVTAANSATYWANPANRLQNADGPWGSRTYYAACPRA